MPSWHSMQSKIEVANISCYSKNLGENTLYRWNIAKGKHLDIFFFVAPGKVPTGENPHLSWMLPQTTFFFHFRARKNGLPSLSFFSYFSFLLNRLSAFKRGLPKLCCFPDTSFSQRKKTDLSVYANALTCSRHLLKVWNVSFVSLKNVFEQRHIFFCKSFRLKYQPQKFDWRKINIDAR